MVFGSSPAQPRPLHTAQPIPQSEAKAIADRYGYDQVIIIARGRAGAETLTTFGRTVELCKLCDRLGKYLRHEVLAWLRESSLRAR